MSTPMNLNPMGLNPQQGAAIVGNASAQVPTEPSSSAPNPAQAQMYEFLSGFKNSWSIIEDLNSRFSGDEEAFKTLQKAAETWISTIVPNLSESTSPETQPNQTPTY